MIRTCPCVCLYLPSFSSRLLSPSLEVNMLFCSAPESPWCFIQQFLWTRCGQHSLVPSPPSLPSSDRYVRVSESLLSSLLADTSLHLPTALYSGARVPHAPQRLSIRPAGDEGMSISIEKERQFVRSALSLYLCSLLSFSSSCIWFLWTLRVKQNVVAINPVLRESYTV